MLENIYLNMNQIVRKNNKSKNKIKVLFYFNKTNRNTNLIKILNKKKVL